MAAPSSVSGSCGRRACDNASGFFESSLVLAREGLRFLWALRDIEVEANFLAVNVLNERTSLRRHTLAFQNIRVEGKLDRTALSWSEEIQGPLLTSSNRKGVL